MGVREESSRATSLLIHILLAYSNTTTTNTSYNTSLIFDLSNSTTSPAGNYGLYVPDLGSLYGATASVWAQKDYQDFGFQVDEGMQACSINRLRPLVASPSVCGQVYFSVLTFLPCSRRHLSLPHVRLAGLVRVHRLGQWHAGSLSQVGCLQAGRGGAGWVLDYEFGPDLQCAECEFGEIWQDHTPMTRDGNGTKKRGRWVSIQVVVGVICVGDLAR